FRGLVLHGCAVLVDGVKDGGVHPPRRLIPGGSVENGVSRDLRLADGDDEIPPVLRAVLRRVARAHRLARCRRMLVALVDDLRRVDEAAGFERARAGGFDVASAVEGTSDVHQGTSGSMSSATHATATR